MTREHMRAKPSSKPSRTPTNASLDYGVDLGTRISTNLDSHSDSVRELHAHNGLIITRAAQVQKKTYSIHNVDARAKTLIVEHPVRAGYNLIDTAKPSETARNVYRFEIKLPANGALDFPVTEEHVFDTQTSVSSLNPDGLLPTSATKRSATARGSSFSRSPTSRPRSRTPTPRSTR